MCTKAWLLFENGQKIFWAAPREIQGIVSTWDNAKMLHRYEFEYPNTQINEKPTYCVHFWMASQTCSTFSFTHCQTIFSSVWINLTNLTNRGNWNVAIWCSVKHKILLRILWIYHIFCTKLSKRVLEGRACHREGAK